MSKEEKTPYLVVNENGDTFTFYVKGTKPYKDLQDKIGKAIEYIKNHFEDTKAKNGIPFCMKLLEILGDKENE